MSLQTKLLLSLVLLAIVPLVVFGMIAYSVSTNSLSNVERNDLQGAVGSVSRALTVIEQGLSRTILDYSDWDEVHTQAAKASPDQDFLNTNFGADASASVLTIHNLTIVGLWNDKDQKPLYSVGNLDALMQRQPDALQQALKADKPITRLLPVEESLYLVSMAPVLTSDGKDPNGVLLIARPLGAADSDQIKALTGYDVALYTGHHLLAATQNTTQALTPSPQALAVAAAGQQFFDLNDQGTALAYQPLKDESGSTIGTIVVWQSRAAIMAAQTSIAGTLLPVFIFSALLAVLVALMLRNSIAKPLIVLADSADKLAEGELLQPVVAPSTGDELGRLADAFNRMAAKVGERLGASEAENVRLQERDEYRLNLLTEITQSLRGPISQIQNHGQLLGTEMHGALNEAQRKSVTAIRHAVNVEKALLSDLLDYARAQQNQLRIERERLSLNSLVREVGETIRERYADKHIQFQPSLPNMLPAVFADPTRMGQALERLLDWAFDFSTPRSQVALSAVQSGGNIEISISNSGRAFSSEEQTRVFDLFYHPVRDSSRPSGNGSGLGMAFVKALIEQQGGTIALQAQPGKGNTFRFTLPIAN